jgi:hypothetical protein
MADAASILEDEGMQLGFNKRTRSSRMFLDVNSPGGRGHQNCASLDRKMDELGLRSVMTTLHRSNTSFSFLSSISRSVFPDAVPVGRIASLTASWITRV